MENRAHALAAGLFVLLLGAALVAVAAWLQRDTQRLVPYVIATTRSVSGLKAEAPVSYRGLEVGRVESMRLDPASPGQILIGIGVAAGTPVTKATYAQLGFQGVTGLATVQLNDEGPVGAPLASESGAPARIPLRPSLLDAGEGLLTSVGEATARVNALLGDENQQLVKRTLVGLEQVTTRVGDLATQLESGTRGLPTLVQDAQGVARRAEGLVADLTALTNKLDQRIATLDRIAGAADRIGGAADDAGASVRAARDESIPRLNALLDQLHRETRTLDRLLTTLNDQPQSVVFGTPPPRPGPGEPGFDSEEGR